MKMIVVMVGETVVHVICISPPRRSVSFQVFGRKSVEFVKFGTREFASNFDKVVVFFLGFAIQVFLVHVASKLDIITTDINNQNKTDYKFASTQMESKAKKSSNIPTPQPCFFLCLNLLQQQLSST